MGATVRIAILANAAYAVVASVVDGAGNAGTAEQELTVDTVLPVVTLDGGSSVTTNDPTPTIAGHSDVAVGTTVRVTVGAQSLNALVHASGSWNITPAPLTDGVRTVTASVTDPAGNQGSDSQLLTVDTIAPAATIAGGENALTDDATPDISGTADVAVGATVTVTLANETLTGVVETAGAWSVTAAALADGPHRVVLSVSDAAGNQAAVTQWLTVDTVAPLVTITGGATRTTNDVQPTITGTSDAMPGTRVTVRIAGQTLTTLVQGDGTWNTTPTEVGAGAWPVAAEAPDPAGNVGRAEQTLIIDTGGVTPTPSPSPSSTPTPTSTPTSTPAPPVAVGPAIDAAAETAVASDARQKLKGASLSVGTRVRASIHGGVVATARGNVRIKGVKNAIRLTTATATLAAGQGATLKLKVKGSTRVARAALRKIKLAAANGRRVTASITVELVDAAGRTRTVKRTVTLKT